MGCVRCRKKVFMSSFCRKHFIENIEKRVKKDIRQEGLIKKGEKLAITDRLCRHFITDVMNLPVKTCRKGRKVLLWTMDDEILAFLSGFFRGKMSGKGKDKSIKLFRTIKDKELEAYAKQKSIRFSRKRTKEEKIILSEIDKLEKEHKETRFSLANAIHEISNL